MSINGKSFDDVNSFEDIKDRWSFEDVLTALRRYEQAKAYRAEYNKRPERVDARSRYNKRKAMIIRKAEQAIKEGRITLDEL